MGSNEYESGLVSVFFLTSSAASLSFIGMDVNKLDNKLRQNGVTHGGGNQTNPTQVKILEWLKKEGIE